MLIMQRHLYYKNTAFVVFVTALSTFDTRQAKKDIIIHQVLFD